MPMLSSPRRLLIIDPSLRARHGHHFNAVMRLIALGRELGMEATTLIHNSADPTVFEQTRGIGAFSMTMYDRTRWTRSELFLHSRAISRQLQAAMLRLQLNFDVIIAPTGNQVLLNGLADLYRAIPTAPPPLLFWLLTPPHPRKPADDPAQIKYKKEYRRIFANLRESIGSDRSLWIFTETELLASLYSELSGIPVHVLQTPNFASRGAAVSNDLHRPFTVVCAGHANVGKGYHLLPEAIEKVHALRPDIQFKIHAGDRYSDGLSGMAIDRIRQHEKNVVVTDAEFDADDYLEWLRAADLLLLPYDPKLYNARGSGIYAEAERLGIPSAATLGCFFSREGIEKGRTLSIRSFTSEAVAEAILQAPNHIEALRRDCLAHADTLRRLESQPPLATILSSISRDTADSYKVPEMKFQQRMLERMKKAPCRFSRSCIRLKRQPDKFQLSLFDNLGQEFVREEPKLKYLIAALGRSGSNLLTRQLFRAGAGKPAEYFNTRLTNLTPEELSDPAYWNFLLKYRKTRSGIFGMKLHFEYLDGLSTECISEMFQRNTKVVMTRRRDLAAQAISLEKARATGFWDPHHQSIKFPGADHRQRERVIACAREIVDFENRWFSLLERHQLTPLIIYYEDHLCQHSATYETLFRFLAVKGKLPNVETNPYGKTMNDWRDRVNAIDLAEKIRPLQSSRQYLNSALEVREHMRPK